MVQDMMGNMMQNGVYAGWNSSYSILWFVGGAFVFSLIFWLVYKWLVEKKR